MISNLNILILNSIILKNRLLNNKICHKFMPILNFLCKMLEKKHTSQNYF